jgi:hypothetical protein
MPYITMDEVRQVAKSRLQKSYGVAANQILRESTNVPMTAQFDVFLSHSLSDHELVLGVRELLQNRGLVVYVDWVQDSQLNRNSITVETAEVLRQRMRASKSLLYVATANSTHSKWMPWELGYFDGFRGGSIGVLPVVQNQSDRPAGQEYLLLYPTVEINSLPGPAGYYVIEKSRRGWRTLDGFVRGADITRTATVIY